jgi:hypothetical protein
LNRKWPYHATVMKRFEPNNKRIGTTRAEIPVPIGQKEWRVDQWIGGSMDEWIGLGG